MNTLYDTDSRFNCFKKTSSGLFWVVMRLILGALSGIWFLIQAVPRLQTVIHALPAERQSTVFQLLPLASGTYALMLGIIIALIVLFFKRKKAFIYLYIFTGVLFAASYFFSMQTIYGLASVALETLIIAYLFTSKSAAVYFRHYNRVNKAALDAFSVRQTKEALKELEDLSNDLAAGKISMQFFEAKKRMLLPRI